MITEERLRSLLDEAASAFHPPADAQARILAAGSVPAPQRRRFLRPGSYRLAPRRIVVAAAGVVVVLAAGLAWVDRGGGGGGAADLAGAGRGQERADQASSQAKRQPQSPSSSHAQLQSQPQPQPMAQSVAQPPNAASAPGPSAQSFAQVQPTSGAGQGALDSGLAKIVKTGTMELTVPKGSVDDAMATISRVAGGAGGYVADSTTAEVRGRPAATVTIRVPADRFDAVTAELRDLGKVRRASSASRDVTGEYADVQARLRTLTGTRDSLLQVLAEAGSVGDILAVQGNLGSVQSEIEQLQGRQRVLDDQTALATLSLSVHEPGAARTPTKAEADRSSWQRAVDGFTGTWSSLLAHSGTAVAVVLIGAALLIVLAGLGRWGRRRYARWVL